MVTKKAAKKAARGAKKSGKTASKKTGKKAGKTSAASNSPIKKVTAKDNPPAKNRRPPAKKSGKRRLRSSPLIVEVNTSGLTLETSRGSPVAYELVLFVDQTHWTPAQRIQVEEFVASLRLHPVALGKGWGRP